MRQIKPKASPRRPPWWLSGGEEECPHCGLLYAYEVEYRCGVCDGPSCPHCKQTAADLQVICPGCAADAKSS